MNRAKPLTRRSGSPREVRRIRVLIDSATSWGRNIIAGIHRYQCSRPSWRILLEARGADELLRTSGLSVCEGVIARIASDRLNDELKASGLPVVNVSGIRLRRDSFPRIHTDLAAGARMAVSYFRERGFEHFGYFSPMNRPFVRDQQEAFGREVIQQGGVCAPPAARGSEQLSGWLARQPKPLALFTWNAAGAQRALQACQDAGLRVPEEVAILSGTDDDLLCELSHIPISGIQVSGEEIGYESAGLLDRLMDGACPPGKPLLIAPVKIISRLSTQILAVRDPALVRALEYIRERASDPLSVDAVARHAGLSRRVLERRFSALLKRTPALQIRHVRIARAEELLTRTNLTIPQVAEASGFGSPEYLAFVFRGSGLPSPLRYRRSHQVG